MWINLAYATACQYSPTEGDSDTHSHSELLMCIAPLIVGSKTAFSWVFLINLYMSP
jgi:hypothetical protein